MQQSTPAELSSATSTFQFSEEQVREFIAGMPFAIAFIDLNLQCLMTSQQWREQLETARSLSPTQSFWEAFLQQHPQLKAAIQQCLTSACKLQIEEEISDSQNQSIWFLWKIAPWQISQNTVAGCIVSIENITLHKQKEQELAQLKITYSALLDQSSDCLCHLSLEGRFLYINQRGVQMHKLDDARQIHGQDFVSIVSFEYHPLIRQALNRAKRGESTQLSYLSTNIKGEEIVWRSTFNAIEDEQGTVIGIRVASQDISEQEKLETQIRQLDELLEEQVEERTAELQQVVTKLEQEVCDRKVLEQKLRSSEDSLLAREKQYQQILNSITDIVLVKGSKSRIIWANRAFYEHYGISEDDLKNEANLPACYRDQTKRHLREDAFVFNTGKTLRFEESIARCDGEIRLFSTIKSAIRDKDNRVKMTVAVSRDITEQVTAQHQQKQAEEAFEQSQKRLELLVEQMPIAFMEWNKDFQIVQWNPAAERIFGYCAEEVLGQSINLLIPESAQLEVEKVIKHLLHHKEGVSSSNPNITKDGK